MWITFRSLPRNKDYWNPVVDRCRKKLTRWKANYLLFGGRITLIKATLSSLPIYFLSLFKIPKGVVVEIELLQNQFLWQGDEASKPHLIKWKTVSSRKQAGGLALGRIIDKNKALLGKWLWQYSLEIQSLWTVVIRSKYRHPGNKWTTDKLLHSSQHSPWKGISQIRPSFLSLNYLWDVAT